MIKPSLNFCAIKWFLFFEGHPNPPEIAQAGFEARQGLLRNYKFLWDGVKRVPFSVNKMLAVIFDLDWWIARVLSLLDDMQPNIYQDENIHSAFWKLLTYISSRILQICGISRYIYVTTLFIYLKWRVMTLIEPPPNEEGISGQSTCRGPLV